MDNLQTFQSTHPTRGCDVLYVSKVFPITFQSTHPTRGCDGVTNVPRVVAYISIHAPHEGVRRTQPLLHRQHMYFNPRTPRGGATELYQETNRDTIFQSTHPTRGCDLVVRGVDPWGLFQSTHPTRGCDTYESGSIVSNTFQSTHPTRGCDMGRRAAPAGYAFQSTHPTRGCDSSR